MGNQKTKVKAKTPKTPIIFAKKERNMEDKKYFEMELNTMLSTPNQTLINQTEAQTSPNVALYKKDIA